MKVQENVGIPQWLNTDVNMYQGEYNRFISRELLLGTEQRLLKQACVVNGFDPTTTTGRSILAHYLCSHSPR